MRNSFYNRFLKRFFDIVLSFFALVLLSPLLAVLAVLVRTKLGSPVLFTQERPGKDEKILRVMKFKRIYETYMNGFRQRE